MSNKVFESSNHSDKASQAEMRFASHYLNLAGMAFVVAGIGLLLRSHVDQGALACGGGTLVGLALLWCGHQAHRSGLSRYGHPLLAAGFAILLLTAGAAHFLFGMLNEPGLFAAVTLLATWAGMAVFVYDSLLVGNLMLAALFGGPIVLGYPFPHPLGLAVYLVAINLAVSLTAFFKKWDYQLLVAFLASYTLYLQNFGLADPRAALTVLTAIYLLFLASDHLLHFRTGNSEDYNLYLSAINPTAFAAVSYLALVKVPNLAALGFYLLMAALHFGLARLGRHFQRQDSRFVDVVWTNLAMGLLFLTASVSFITFFSTSTTFFWLVLGLWFVEAFALQALARGDVRTLVQGFSVLAFALAVTQCVWVLPTNPNLLEVTVLKIGTLLAAAMYFARTREPQARVALGALLPVLALWSLPGFDSPVSLTVICLLGVIIGRVADDDADLEPLRILPLLLMGGATLGLLALPLRADLGLLCLPLAAGLVCLREETRLLGWPILVKGCLCLLPLGPHLVVLGLAGLACLAGALKQPEASIAMSVAAFIGLMMEPSAPTALLLSGLLGALYLARGYRPLVALFSLSALAGLALSSWGPLPLAVLGACLALLGVEQNRPEAGLVATMAGAGALAWLEWQFLPVYVALAAAVSWRALVKEQRTALWSAALAIVLACVGGWMAGTLPGLAVTLTAAWVALRLAGSASVLSELADLALTLYGLTGLVLLLHGLGTGPMVHLAAVGAVAAGASQAWQERERQRLFGLAALLALKAALLVSQGAAGTLLWGLMALAVLRFGQPGASRVLFFLAFLKAVVYDANLVFTGGSFEVAMWGQLGLAQALAMLALVGVFLAGSRGWHSDAEHRNFMLLLALMTFAFQVSFFVYNFYGILEVFQVILSAVWCFFAFCFIAYGIYRQVKVFRLFGLATLVAAALKIVCVDLYVLNAYDRVTTLVILGAIMMVVAFLYQSHAEELQACPAAA